MEFKNIENLGSDPLTNYLETNSRLLVPAEKISQKDILKPMTASLTYNDAKNIKVNLDGYNITYTDKDGSLRTTFLTDNATSELEQEMKKASIGQNWDVLQKALEKIGYTVTHDNRFDMAVSKQLELNK